MRFNVLNRKIHYWATAFIALPVLVVICSGLILQMKKHWAWVQPVEQRGTGTSPSIDLDAILASVREVTHLGVAGWDDVNRIDVRPGRGLAKVWLRNGWEVQVDLGTGRVLQSAYRRSDLIESLHDGSFFAGNVSKLGIFLPTGIALLVMWVTGLWMFFQPFVARRKAARRRLT
ncbi:MAG: PepSY domain-containing protein [Acidobacteriota bacterium]|nr:PepSY domain-containing protein [Acidobacteriota bacterium]